METRSDGEQDADAEEMPLLFMDGLPSDFQQSAQLAALATFMADSDDEQTSESDGEPLTAGKRPPIARRRRSARLANAPYARSTPNSFGRDDTDSSATQRRKESGEKAKKKKEKERDVTKELQLFLSMFKV